MTHSEHVQAHSPSLASFSYTHNLLCTQRTYKHNHYLQQQCVIFVLTLLACVICFHLTRSFNALGGVLIIARTDLELSIVLADWHRFTICVLRASVTVARRAERPSAKPRSIASFSEDRESVANSARYSLHFLAQLFRSFSPSASTALAGTLVNCRGLFRFAARHGDISFFICPTFWERFVTKFLVYVAALEAWG